MSTQYFFDACFTTCNLTAWYTLDGHSQVFRYFLLSYQFIPISLYVTMSGVGVVRAGSGEDGAGGSK